MGKTVLLLLGGMLFCILAPANAQTPKIDYYSCQKNSDCILVSDGCFRVAINKKFLNEWNQKLEKERGSFGCAAVLESRQIGQYWQATCDNNKCVKVLIDPLWAKLFREAFVLLGKYLFEISIVTLIVLIVVVVIVLKSIKKSHRE